jgi:dihydroorotate dehydrogenase
MRISSGKRELNIDPPWMNTAGAIGFSDETSHALDLSRLGAFVTHPVSQRPRRPASVSRLVDFPGGFLLHTGLPNDGLRAVVGRHQHRWRRMPIPIIVHIIPDDASALERMLLQLETLESISGVEVGLNLEEPSEIGRLLSSVARCELPVIVRLSVVAGIQGATAAVASGAAAICLVPPRGALSHSDPRRSGRMWGPAVFPLMLKRTAELAPLMETPLIISGGIRQRSDVSALLDAGASAIQLDFALWSNPAILDTPPPPGQ